MQKPHRKAPTPFKYYSEKDFNYDLMFSREFSDSDAIAVIRLYRIDVVKSHVHRVYGEAKPSQKRFLTPIEMNVTITIGDLEHNNIGGSGINRQNPSTVELGIYKEEMEEKNVNINKGDFFAYFDGERERFYEIVTVSNIASNNSTIGYKPFYMTFTAVHVLRDAIEEYFNN